MNYKLVTGPLSKSLFAIGVACGLWAFPSVAAAEPLTHDGFFFQGSLGFGPGWMNETLENDLVEQEFSLSGLTGTLEFLFGGTPAPGLVLGAGLAGHSIVNPTLEVDGQEFETEDTSVAITQLSLFTHWYANATGGLYLHGSVGYGSASVTVDDTTRDTGTNGIVLGVGAGYDVWVGSEWSLGPQLRLTYAHLTGEEDGVDASDNFISPTLAFSVTYH